MATPGVLNQDLEVVLNLSVVTGHCVSTPLVIASESENDSDVSLSESKEKEFPSSSQSFRRETRATRRAMQTREARRKNGEAAVLPSVLFTPNCKSRFILTAPSIFLMDL